MIFILIVAVLGELVTLAFFVPFFDFLTALLLAPVGGGLAALAAGLFLTLKA